MSGTDVGYAATRSGVSCALQGSRASLRGSTIADNTGSGVQAVQHAEVTRPGGSGLVRGHGQQGGAPLCCSALRGGVRGADIACAPLSQAVGVLVSETGRATVTSSSIENNGGHGAAAEKGA
eukprot:3602231-Rhodomonas_salina.2